MKVEDLMTERPTTCSVSDHLAAAAMKMWDRDCGILPVLGADGLEGVITDRDIAMALGMKGAAATRVRVGEVITGRLYSCAPDDAVADALAVMREHRVRRLPVVDSGRLVGVVSLNDVVLVAGPRAGAEEKPTEGEVVGTLRVICEHRKLPTAA